MLEAAGFARFACVDGFIGVDLQSGVPAWSSSTARHQSSSTARDQTKLRGLTSSSVQLERNAGSAPMNASLVHSGGSTPFLVTAKMDQQGILDSQAVTRSADQYLGFAAPIYESLASFEAGDEPVAWAVKAGSPVKRSVCDNNLGLPGTCGMFVLGLQKRWSRFLLAPEWFGKSWGFNITHFSQEQMRLAVNQIRHRNPAKNLTGPGELTFVVAEDVRQYFGNAYSALWVVFSLVTLGFLDRLIGLLDMEPLQSCDQDSSELHSRHYASDIRAAWQQDRAENVYRTTACSSPCILEDAQQFWLNALGPPSRPAQTD